MPFKTQVLFDMPTLVLVLEWSLHGCCGWVPNPDGSMPRATQPEKSAIMNRMTTLYKHDYAIKVVETIARTEQIIREAPRI